MENPMNLPRYFIAGERPVMAVQTPNGGMQTMVYDWLTGDFVLDQDYVRRVIAPEGDIDEVTQAELAEQVAKLRAEGAAS